jgi:hypothetical protein
MDRSSAGTARPWFAPALSHEQRATSQRALRLLFGAYILAFALKHIGASWDVAWHFRFLRDDLIPPHIINLAGNFIAGGLLFFQYRTGVGVERRSFLVMLAGLAMFVIAVPLDVLNHRIFGLDVTIWSPPHLTLFFGSTICLLGLLWSWLQQAAPGAWRTAYTFVFLVLVMDCAIFVLGQQEYGVLALDAYNRGVSTASADLIALARGNVARFVSGGIPEWLYPLWMVTTATAVMLLARLAQPGRWTATLIAALYLLYRAVGAALLTAAEFPPSFIPLMLLFAALALDLAARAWRAPLASALAVVAAFYGSAALIGAWTLMPPFAPWTAPLALLAVWGEAAASSQFRVRRFEL